MPVSPLSLEALEPVLDTPEPLKPDVAIERFRLEAASDR